MTEAMTTTQDQLTRAASAVQAERAVPAPPCAMVIFGASGDLTRRKLFPALYALAYRRLLPERFGVVGFALPRRYVQRHPQGEQPVGERRDAWAVVP